MLTVSYFKCTEVCIITEISYGTYQSVPHGMEQHRGSTSLQCPACHIQPWATDYQGHSSSTCYHCTNETSSATERCQVEQGTLLQPARLKEQKQHSKGVCISGLWSKMLFKYKSKLNVIQNIYELIFEVNIELNTAKNFLYTLLSNWHFNWSCSMRFKPLKACCLSIQRWNIPHFKPEILV